MFPPPPLPAAPRNHAPPSGGAAPLSAHTPPGRAARRQGNADLWPVLPVGAGTAARSAAKPRIAQWRCSAPLRTYPTGQSGAQARERRPPVGTRWPPASARRIAEWRCGAPLGTYPTEQSSMQARERRPPVGTRWPPASARRIAPWRRGAPLGTYPTEQSSMQARERRPPASSPGGGRHALASGQRAAHRPVAARRSSPHIPHRAEQHAGKGTPTSGRHRCAKRSERRVPRSRPDDAERRGPGREANHPELGVLSCRPPAAGCADRRSAFPCPRVAPPGGWGTETCTIPELHFHAGELCRRTRPLGSSPGGAPHRPPEAGERRTLDGPDGPPAPVHFREGHACRHPARRSTT